MFGFSLPVIFVGIIVLLLFFRYLLAPARPSSHLLKKTLAPEAFKKNVDSIAQMQKHAPKTGKNYCIIGVGFVGRALVEYLLDRGEGTKACPILCIDIMEKSPFETEPRYLHSTSNFMKDIDSSRLRYRRGDVTKQESIVAIFEEYKKDFGASLHSTFLTAAMIAFYQRLPHQWSLSEAINAQGAKNVVNALIECSIPNLILTSTSHVALKSMKRVPGYKPEDLDESAPYVSREESINHYGPSKALAEKYVLEKNGTPLKDATKGNLKTVAVRPASGVYGMKDKNMLDFLFDPTHGQQYMCDADAMWINYIFVENVVFGELLAEKHLLSSSADNNHNNNNNNNNNNNKEKNKVAGEAFLIGGPKHNSHQLYDLTRSHYPGDEKDCRIEFLPKRLLQSLTLVSEFLQGVFPKKDFGEFGMLTPATVELCEMSYTFKDDKARKTLGFFELYTLEEALQKAAWQFYNINQEKKKQQQQNKKKD